VKTTNHFFFKKKKSGLFQLPKYLSFIEDTEKNAILNMGAILNFCEKSFNIKVKYLKPIEQQKKNLIKRRFVGFRSKSYFGGHLELSGYFRFWSIQIPAQNLLKHIIEIAKSPKASESLFCYISKLSFGSHLEFSGHFEFSFLATIFVIFFEFVL
jgi:hypothetical protein